MSEPALLPEPTPPDSLLAPGDTPAETARVPSPLPQALGQDFDWSTPVRSRLAAEPLELNWDDDKASDTSTDTEAVTQMVRPLRRRVVCRGAVLIEGDGYWVMCY